MAAKKRGAKNARAKKPAATRVSRASAAREAHSAVPGMDHPDPTARPDYVPPSRWSEPPKEVR